MTKRRRDRLKIYGELLEHLSAEPDSEKIVITKIQLKINVPFDRFKKYIKELKTLGFIEDENTLKVTEKGKQYIIEYEAVLKFVERMGLSYK